MTIVVVDRDRVGLLLVSELLAALGRPVQSFADPDTALAWMRDNEVDLLVTDLRLGSQGGGLTLTQQVRAMAHTADTPVMMLTTLELRRRRIEAFTAGVTDFAVKPIDPTELHARASALLRLSLAQSALKDRARTLATAVDQATAALISREEEIIRRLATAADRRDHVTGDHIARVADYARLIAEAMGLQPAEVRLITLAAPLHDIGKIGVPDAVLNKRANFTEAERAVMEQHTLYAEEILGNSSWDLLRIAAEIGVGHHERWDGTGYPRRLAGTDIPLPARIVAVADVFDALVSERPYKHAWPLDEARAHLLAERGRQFDPACVDAFLSRWDEAGMIAERALAAWRDTVK
jgi:putative two-component system response regulator